MRKKIDLTGQRFGRLLVLEEAGRNERGQALWLCRCDCGQTKTFYSGNLKNGHTKSCGCLSRELASLRLHKVIASNTKHGRSKRGKVHYLYNAWKTIFQRCTRPSHKSYSYYKDIPVYSEWLGEEGYINFENYILTNLGGRPTPKHSIDRIDNDKGYEPNNLRWATRSEQAWNRNTSGTKLTPELVAYIKEQRRTTMRTYKDIAEELGCSQSTVWRAVIGKIPIE